MSQRSKIAERLRVFAQGSKITGTPFDAEVVARMFEAGGFDDLLAPPSSALPPTPAPSCGCAAPRIIVDRTDGFHPRRGCLACDKWLEPVRCL